MFRALANKSKVASNGHLGRYHCPTFGSQSVLRFSQQHEALVQQRYMSTGPGQTMEFQAATRKILDIVTNSIYTDKEVFLRELVSNASDSLEKYRYMQVNQEVVADGATGAADNTSQDSEINIITDTTSNTLTIIDNGIGMNKDELIANLGTIARSGSKQFVQEMEGSESKGNTSNSSSTKEGIIGQFGVGFYSSFMVSDSVIVESISAAAVDGADSANPTHKWESDGTGQFTITDQTGPVDGLARGSKITMHLKEDCKEFSDPERIKEIIKKYSSFVSFPIKVNGEAVNTVSAIWMEEQSR